MLWPLLMCGVLALGLAGDFEETKARGCFSEEELPHRADKLLHARAHRPHNFFEERLAQRSDAPLTCADFQLQPRSAEYSNRSVSPWRYRVDEDAQRFPRAIAVAECLCEGCIINGKEDMHTYNSVPVEQTRMVLRRTACPVAKGKYSLTVHFIKVPVACICVVPRQ